MAFAGVAQWGGRLPAMNDENELQAAEVDPVGQLTTGRTAAPGI